MMCQRTTVEAHFLCLFNSCIFTDEKNETNRARERRITPGAIGGGKSKRMVSKADFCNAREDKESGKYGLACGKYKSCLHNNIKTRLAQQNASKFVGTMDRGATRAIGIAES